MNQIYRKQLVSRAGNHIIFLIFHQNTFRISCRQSNENDGQNVYYFLVLTVETDSQIITYFNALFTEFEELQKITELTFITCRFSEIGNFTNVHK